MGKEQCQDSSAHDETLLRLLPSAGSSLGADQVSSFTYIYTSLLDEEPEAWREHIICLASLIG